MNNLQRGAGNARAVLALPVRGVWELTPCCFHYLGRGQPNYKMKGLQGGTFGMSVGHCKEEKRNQNELFQDYEILKQDLEVVFSSSCCQCMVGMGSSPQELKGPCMPTWPYLTLNLGESHLWRLSGSWCKGHLDKNQQSYWLFCESQDPSLAESTDWVAHSPSLTKPLPSFATYAGPSFGF